MKMIKKLFLVQFVAFALFACNSDDDGFYNETYVNAQNLVNIETQPAYQVDDVLYINAFIPKLLAQPNTSTLLDVRKSTGNADSFSFNIILEKQGSDGEWSYVELNNSFVPLQGDVVEGSLIRGILVYYDAIEQYVFRGGIRLNAAGIYRVSFSNNIDTTDKIELRSDSTGDNLRMNIATTTLSFNERGTYRFIVN